MESPSEKRFPIEQIYHNRGDSGEGNRPLHNVFTNGITFPDYGTDCRGHNPSSPRETYDAQEVWRLTEMTEISVALNARRSSALKELHAFFKSFPGDQIAVIS